MTGPASTKVPLQLRARVGVIVNSVFDSPDLSAFILDDRLRTRSAAVVVLAHAEIEEAIEDACREVADALESRPPIGFAFLAWGLSPSQIHDTSASTLTKQVKAGGTVPHLLTAYRTCIGNSHGVRESNLKQLLAPLGFSLKSLAVEVATLDAFGKLRGETAHLSPLKARIQDAPSAIVRRCDAAAVAAERIISDLSHLTVSLSSATQRFPAQLSLMARLRLRIGL